MTIGSVIWKASSGPAADQDFHAHQPNEWQWRLLLRVSEFITQAQLDAAIKAAKEKGKSPIADQVKLEQLTEGRCVQMLHIGPYGEEKRREDYDRQDAPVGARQWRTSSRPASRNLSLGSQPRPTQSPEDNLALPSRVTNRH